VSSSKSGARIVGSRRPYLLRAMYEWINDSGYTPHLIVDAQQPGVEVPPAYVKDGKIVLNLSAEATQHLQLRNDLVEFDARFTGVAHHVRVPVRAVLGVYARETGEGMIFSDTESDNPEPPEPSPAKPAADAPARRRAKLTVVK
jgi:stringent starvation protein B